MFQMRVAAIVNASYTNVVVVSYTPTDRKIDFIFVTSDTNPAPMNAVDLANKMTAIFTSSEAAVQSALGVTGFSPPYAPASSQPSGPSIGLIAGAAAGGLVAVIIIAVVVSVVVRRRRREAGGETFVSMNTQMNDLELHLNADDYRESHV
jgi:hypothetical protein